MARLKAKIFFLILAAFLLMAGFWQFQKSRLNFSRALINGQEFNLEIADTDERKKLGLGERDALCRDCGMLFVFSETGKSSFWMKGMRFPLDIIWINSKSGKVVRLEKDISADSHIIYASPESADYVLEINGGLADQYSIQEGNNISFE